MLTATPQRPSATATTSSSTQTSSEKDEIWSTILKGVASSKMVPTKNILLLGDSGCGKSTLIHYLKNDPGPQPVMPETDNLPPSSFNVSASNNYTPMPIENLDDDMSNNLALGYTFVDIQDEENEVIARLGLYQLGLSAPEYLPLLKFALSANTLADSMVVLVLDWTRPWKFLESLQRWMNVLEHTMNEIRKEGGNPDSSWTRGKAVLDELREKVELYLKTYTEPVPNSNGFNLTASTSTSSVPSTPTNNFVSTSLVTTTTVADQVTLPLPTGCLTSNYGIPITVVCCKSDHFTKLEQTHDYKDDQFDFIQQTLRCVCMKYGAALFYTSTLKPYTFHNLRQYILHRVLTTSSKTYPYLMKAQVVERDSVAVPSGWDSWGKIRVLRDGFDCEAVNQGWDADMESILDRQPHSAHGARGIYEEVIISPDTEEQPLNIPPAVTCEDEQVFLERHFETLQRASDGPSRQGTGASATARPSVVGPLGVSSATIDLMQVGSDKENDITSRSSRSKDDKLLNMGPSPIQTTPSVVGLTSGTTSPLGAGGAGGAGGASNEVLANFFQSLLSKKAASGGSPTSASPTSSLLNGTLTSNGGGTGGSIGLGGGRDETGSGRRSTLNRKEVHKELNRMRQSVNKP
ncbi:dynein light intermediate chain-domain-containing protein [Halteromyces radiatus]|uniref:dynein light intermediate chain-domain-containing protein n=1 Tax=Halteromyces radiatus TaxID=101107 RepID=UPI00222098B0|nr:dynein light intermediate chain-domain-containing protein [Halteromyces radiatus]KAI8088769.1 dynein light intermediate chain-domain-containing protein [Halteromyces radiatus]